MFLLLLFLKGDNVFTAKLDEEDDIYVTESGNSTAELSMSDSYQEKFRHLNIEAELSVSLLCGMIKLSGSGKYLDEKRESDHNQCMSLIYTTTTVTEEVFLKQLRKNISTGMFFTDQKTGHFFKANIVCRYKVHCKYIRGNFYSF